VRKDWDGQGKRAACSYLRVKTRFAIVEGEIECARATRNIFGSLPSL
jgi:hypothetical protein